jgi:hypothetical protein
MGFRGDIKTALQNLTSTKRQKIVDAYCDRFRYQNTIPNPSSPGTTVPNPQSRTDFTADRIADGIARFVDQYDRDAQIAALPISIPVILD